MAEEVKTYHVVVTREAGSWLADVPELEGTHTWGRNLIALQKAVREAIVLAEDLPTFQAPSLVLDLVYRTGDEELDAKAAELRCERVRLAGVEAALLRLTEELARDVERRGLSVRDAAALLGVSPQRIAQIAPRREKTADQHGRGARAKART
jgi:hypothetical protein